MQNIYESIRKKLYDKDYKMTPQRQIILQIFMENTNKHLSAEDVYMMVKRENPDLGMATIYRTVDLLAELEILQKINFGDGRSRYELNHEETHHHHHLICLKCGRVSEFADDLLEALENQIQKNNGFEIVDHQLKFYGYCHKCK